MELRLPKEDEYQKIRKILLSEGHDPGPYPLIEARTLIWGDDEIRGFLCWRPENHVAVLLHFWIRPEDRGQGKGNMMKMIISGLLDMERLGYETVIFHANADNPKLQKTLEWVAGHKPYTQQDGKVFYAMNWR